MAWTDPQEWRLGSISAAILRGDYRIDIDGYGVGHLALWSLA